MLTKEKMLYQVKLIINCLPEEEYNLIPEDTIEYIENNFEYDANITINPEVPLEEQNIDDKTYEMLDKIVKSVEKNKENIVINDAETVQESEDTNQENIKLKSIIEFLKKENELIPKAKVLLEEYKKALAESEEEIERLKKNNQDLYDSLQKVPKLLRKFFIKEDIKLLNSDNEIAE